MDDLEAELAPRPAAPVIEAELVRPSTPPSRRRSTRTTLPRLNKRSDGHIFSDVSLRDGTVARRIRLSERERKLITVFAKTGNVTRAADEIGVTPQTVYNYLRRPAVRAYLEQMRTRAAKAADLTMDKIAGVLDDAVSGDTAITPMQLQAASIAAKILAPARGPSVGITVNQQNNFNGASPFADLTPAAMLESIKKNLLEMGMDESPPSPA